MPNFAQELPLLLFLPFIILIAVAATVWLVHLAIAIGARRVKRHTPGMAAYPRHLSAEEFALSRAIGAALSHSVESVQPVGLVLSKARPAANSFPAG